MTSRTRWALAGLLAAAAAPTAAAQEPSHAEETAPLVPVLGVVVDLQTGTPVPQARVVLRPGDGGRPAERITDGDGWFLLPGVPVGGYTLEVEALGYHPLHHSLAVRELSHLRVTIEIVPRALELEPVVVVTERRTRLDQVGFHERRRTGFGRYLTREDLEARHALYLSDALRTLPGVRVVPAGRGPTGTEVRLRGGCRPALYVDGMRWMDLDHFTLDDLFRADDIEAIEVYHGVWTPGRFWGGSCGSIVIWTRPGQPYTSEGGSFWKRIAFAAGFVALSMLLSP